MEQLANIVEPDLTRIVLGVGSKDEDAVLLFDPEQAFPVSLSHLWLVFSQVSFEYCISIRKAGHG
jgi:hypothetical protein